MSSTKLTGKELKKLYLEGLLTEDLMTSSNMSTLFYYEMIQFESDESNTDLLDLCIEKMGRADERIPQTIVAKNYHGSLSKYYKDQAKNATNKKRDRQRFSKVLQTTAVAASVGLIILSSGKVICDAAGFDLFGFIKEQEGSFSTSFGRKQTHDMFNQEYEPVWIPEGFSFLDATIEEHPQETYVSYQYENANKETINFVLFDYTSANADNPSTNIYETNDSNQKIRLNGKNYYFNTNISYSFMWWKEKHKVFQISTSLLEGEEAEKELLKEIVTQNTN